MGERWHYISNLRGAEELYDLKNDPMEWKNLITHPDHKEIIADMKKWVPTERVKPHTIFYKKEKNYVDAESDPTLKAMRDLNQLK